MKRMLFVLLVLTAVSCKMQFSVDVETVNTIRTAKTVYHCIDCGSNFCKDGTLIPEMPDYDPENQDSIADVGTTCIYCGSRRVTIIGEIDPDGKFVEYEY
jgi:DNA-directed RNA polymerase subunit RPC12/RpoP